MLDRWIPRRRPRLQQPPAEDSKPAPSTPSRWARNLPTADEVEKATSDLDRRLEIIDAQLAVLSEDLDD